MDAQMQRGRSPSAGNKNRNLSHSPSPHQYHDAVSGLGLDPSINVSTFSTGRFNTVNPASTGGDAPFTFSTPYLDASSQSQHLPRTTAADNPFIQHQQFPNTLDNTFNSSYDSLSSKQLQANNPFSSFSTSNQPDFDDFPMFQNNNLDQNFDPSLVLDPQLQTNMQPTNQSINPADLVSRMSSPHNPTPPNLLPPEPHSSPGQPSSPSSTQGQFYTPQHSRHASLDPSSAAFSQGQQPADWQQMLGGAAFQSHRRAPSEHSDVSSSVAPSPFLAQKETFESIENNHSPLLNPQQDPSLYENALGIEQFSLNEPQQQDAKYRISPAHSPYISPRLLPQQGVGMGQENHFMLSQVNHQLSGPGPEIYTDNSFSNMQQRNGSVDMGQAPQMVPPPEINVEFAPPSRNSSFEPGKLGADLEGLSPPVSSM